MSQFCCTDVLGNSKAVDIDYLQSGLFDGLQKNKYSRFENGSFIKNKYPAFTISLNSSDRVIIIKEKDSFSGGDTKMIYLEQEIKKKQNIDRLVQISAFNENWNGYQALPFSNDLIIKCKNIIYDLWMQPQLFPTGRQSIQLEYELDNGKYLEFEVYNDNINVLIIKENGEEEQFLLNHDIDFMNKVVKRFYERNDSTR